MRHTRCVPKLWNDTIDAHRSAVREATVNTTAALVAEHGLASVTMSQIAKETGIGRATLYKYFPDVDSILTAWHERQINAHLAQLSEIGEHPGTPGERLEAVLHAFAFITRGNHDTDLAALLHRGEHVARAQHHLQTFIAELIADAAKAGELRDDIPPGELATYCLHALTSASSLPSKAAVGRLVTVTLAGLRPEPQPPA
jgi:AcrR family transcriptional regulator